MKPLRKVLLVDDDRVTNLMHTRLLNKTGLAKDVDVATDGVAALEYLQDTHTRSGTQPDLILLDINMPRMNGFEFLEAFAELRPNLKDVPKILMLSTSLLEEDRTRARADPNVGGFMAKPLSKDRLMSFVRMPRDGAQGA